jgi:hypothetical protein
MRDVIAKSIVMTITFVAFRLRTDKGKREGWWRNVPFFFFVFWSEIFFFLVFDFCRRGRFAIALVFFFLATLSLLFLRVVVVVGRVSRRIGSSTFLVPAFT